MKSLITLFIIGTVAISLQAQTIDTLAIKNEVVTLKTFQSKKKYLKKIFDEDQLFRGVHTKVELDYEHLIAISYYINEFGYPDKRDFEKLADAPWLIWVHNSHDELKKVTFPIILKGYSIGQYDDRELRTYFLRGLYNLKFDDDQNETMPLSDLFQICEVELGEEISIDRILQAKAKIDRFKRLEILGLSTWKADDTRKNYELNGEMISTTYEGQVIRIIKKANQKLYVLKVHDDKSGEPRELEYISANKYKIKNRETKKYYEFSEHEIVYRDPSEILNVYKLVPSSGE